MNAVAIEKAILAALRQVALKPRELSQMAEEQHETLDREQRPLRNEKRKLERSHRRASEEKARLVDLLVREIVSESDFRTQRDKLDGRIARIQERLQDIESRLTRPGFEDYDLERLVASLGSLKGVYEELTTEERKQLLRTVISRVVIKGRGRNAQVDMALSCLPRFCHYDRIPRRADPLDWPGTVLTALPSGRGGGWRLWIGSPWRGAGGREWGSRAWECRQGTAARVVP